VRAEVPEGHRGVRFSGRITTSHAIRRVRPSGPLSEARISASRRSVAFGLIVAAGQAAGLDFGVSCGSVHFHLLPASGAVRLGSGARAPARSFTVTDPETSGVRGTVLAGPTCPVERAGENCSPRPVATTVDAFALSDPGNDPSSGTPDASATTDGLGRFSLDLAPGRYRLVPRATGPGQSGRPEDVSIAAGIAADVTLTVDTGIRRPEGPPSMR
jgi:hypothetical protein